MNGRLEGQEVINDRIVIFVWTIPLKKVDTCVVPIFRASLKWILKQNVKIYDT